MSRRLVFAFLVLFAVHALDVLPARAGQGAVVEAQREYNAGHYHRAVDALTEAAVKTPNDAALYFLLGQCFYQIRDFTRAVANFERSVQLLPDQSEYHDWLGKAYGRKAEQSMFLTAMGWAKKTHKEFEVAVHLNPSNFEAQRDLIRFEMYAPGIAGGGDGRALKHIEELGKIDALQGQLAQGEFLSAKKRMAEADKVFAGILDSNTDRIGVYLEVADYYRDRPNAAKMSQAVAGAERIDPDDRRLKYYRGIVLVMNGNNLTEAESLLKAYLATVPDNSAFPDHSSALEWLGNLYAGQGKLSEAAAQYRASLALDPHNKTVEEALKRLERSKRS
jgi:tetratricopeptide (TPR) repeat protein